MVDSSLKLWLLLFLRKNVKLNSGYSQDGNSVKYIFWGEKTSCLENDKNLQLPSATRWSPGIYMAKSSLCLQLAIFDYLETDKWAV